MQTNKSISNKGATLIEILLCFAILSVALYPIAFLFQHAGIDEKNSEKEFLATLFAHHATETLVAMRSLDPSYVPQVASKVPITMKNGSTVLPHEYFRAMTASGTCITDLNEPKLFDSIKDFTFSIDTYLLDTRFYKAICKINYQENGINKQIFFERQLYGISKLQDSENVEEDENNIANDDDFTYDDGSLSHE